MQMTSAAAPRVSLAFVLDWTERLIIFSVFTTLVTFKVLSDETGWFLYLYCLSEGLVVLFTLLRRGADQVTIRPGDWIVAAMATLTPMFVKGGGEGLIDINIGIMVFVVGVIWQVWAKLILRRSFGIVAANRGVKVSGPYRYMRHPMYFGYLIMHIGMFLVSPSIWNLAIYALAWGAQIVRIGAEERLLMQDDAYRAFAGNVRYRLIPGVF